MPGPIRLLVPLSAVALLAGCRTAQPPGQAFELTPLYNPNPTRAVVLSVDGPHVYGRPVDARAGFDLEVQQDGCTRGNVGGNQVEVCPVPDPRGGSSGSKTFQVSGPLGARTFTLEQRDDRVYVDFGINQGRSQFVIPDGFLRQHPELIAAAWFYGAFGIPRPGSDTQDYVIEPRRA
jgi:hypothetical protein